jgi:hypothetical protein
MNRMKDSVESAVDSDAIAVERTLAGERDAYRVLVERHSPRDARGSQDWLCHESETTVRGV